MLSVLFHFLFLVLIELLIYLLAEVSHGEKPVLAGNHARWNQQGHRLLIPYKSSFHIADF